MKKYTVPTIILTILFSVFNLSAAVLTVTTLEDTDDAVCDAHCSLREAIAAAAARDDTIIFARELRGGAVNLTRTLLIDKRLTIDAPNKRRITLRGNGTFRILDINRTIVTLDGLIVAGGNAGDESGGGVNAQFSTLVFRNGAVLQNRAARGGGIYISGGSLFMTGSAVAHNTATGAATAGGIDAPNSSLRLTNSTISSNTALSTVDAVGGIRVTPSAYLIYNCTIAYNETSGLTTLSAGGVAAIGIDPSRSTHFYNSVVARNIGRTPDIYGIIGATSSFFGVNQAGGPHNGQSGNIAGTPDNPLDPLLAALANDATGIPFHALLDESAAINAGRNQFAIDYSGGRPLITDQRGHERVFASTVDMGAYENGAPLFAESAAVVTGRVLGKNNRPVSGARIVLREANGGMRIVTTNPFGFYRFQNVTAGLSYVVEAFDKRNHFSPQNVPVEEAVEYVDFRAD